MPILVDPLLIHSSGTSLGPGSQSRKLKPRASQGCCVPSKAEPVCIITSDLIVDLISAGKHTRKTTSLGTARPRRCHGKATERPERPQRGHSQATARPQQHHEAAPRQQRGQEATAGPPGNGDASAKQQRGHEATCALLVLSLRCFVLCCAFLVRSFVFPCALNGKRHRGG